MLQRSTVEPNTLELLNRIMAIEELRDFALVGGTALALQIGHRNSIDLDFFGASSIENIHTIDSFASLGEIKIIRKSSKIFISIIDGIKVDFVNYSYKWLENWKEIDGIRLASIKDIAAMKINAITGRGSKKDFIDLYFLLNDFTLENMLDFFEEKYPDGSKLLALKSISYFGDADIEEMPKMYKNVSWDSIKSKVDKEFKAYVLSL